MSHAQDQGSFLVNVNFDSTLFDSKQKGRYSYETERFFHFTGIQRHTHPAMVLAARRAHLRTDRQDSRRAWQQ